MIKFILAALAFATSPEPPGVLVSVREGKAPLKVRITGPELLVEKVKECKRGIGGLGFSVDWGDGAFSGGIRGGSCEGALEHTYTVPGSYSIEGAVWRPGPTDAPEYIFQGRAEIRVSGVSGKRPVKLRILGEQEDVFYGTGLRPLRVLIDTDRTLELKAELVTENGKVLSASSKTTSATGTDLLPFNSYGDGPGAEDYSSGKVRAKLRVAAFHEGKEVARADGRLFTIHAKANYRAFELKPAGGKAPLTVEASYQFHHRDCHAYIVEWGDGSPDDTGGTVPAKGQGCRLERHVVKLQHTYTKPGTYVIRWYDNDSSPFGPARKGPGYMEKQVRVK